MKIGLFLVAPDHKEGYRLEEEVLKAGHTLTTVNLGKASFIVSNGSAVLLADATSNLKEYNFKKQVIKTSDFEVIITTRMLRFIKEACVFIEYARKSGVRVFDNNLTTHGYVINKVVDELKLGLSGINTPVTAYSSDFKDLPVLAEKIGYPVIFKNTNKGKGVGVQKLENNDQLLKAINEQESAGKTPKTFLIQNFVPYKHDLRVLVVGDKTFTMERIPKRGEFRANFSLGGSVKPFKLSSKTQEIAKKAVRAVGLDIAGVDVLITEKGVNLILEVNHTPGFVGMEEALGINIGSEIIKFMIEYAK